MVILELTKNQIFTLLLENTFFKKPHRVGEGSNSPAKIILGLDFHRMLVKIRN